MLSGKHILFKYTKKMSFPLLMGIINVTPDSFSDGNLYFELPQAIQQAKQLIKDGADILDIGGESSRPGSIEISASDEIERVIPLVEQIRKFTKIPISIDTRKAEVAELSLKAGANIINDISAARFDIDMIKVLDQNEEAGCIIMHMLGEPTTMQEKPQYDDVVNDISLFFTERISFYNQNGISSERIFLDPGIGFGKTNIHNLTIFNKLHEFSKFGMPLVVGASRKRFIGEIVSSQPEERIGGSLAAAGICQEKGVSIIRVHDIKEHFQYFNVIKAIKSGSVL